MLLVGPLLLFNPWFVSVLQARHDVAAELGVAGAEVDRVTSSFLGDLFSGGDFDAGFGDRPLLDRAERSHMVDVSRLVRVLLGVVVVALVAAVVSGRWLRREPRRMARILAVSGSLVGGVAAFVALAFAIAFDAAFLAFHAIFFPPGTYLFAPGSDLIRLFPHGFWFDAALVAGTTVILTAVAVASIGIVASRRPPTPPPAG